MRGATPEIPQMIPSEVQIRNLVHDFYVKVRDDAELGPIFNGAISDWDPHLEKMCAFWSSVMRTSGRYKGNPMVAHLHLKTVRPEHFQRWLSLFADTARDICPPQMADAFISRAENIARSLKLAMFYRPGQSAGGMGESAS